MESNEKKAKRPRIGARPVNDNPPAPVSYQQRDNSYQPRPYQPRPWQPRQESHYNQNFDRDKEANEDGEPRENAYQPRPYNPNYRQNQQRPYNPNYQGHQQRPYNPNYRQNRPQGSYNPNYRQNQGEEGSNYNPNYRPNRPQGSYNPNYRQNRPNQGGYNPNYRNQGGPGRPNQRYNQQQRPGKSFTPRPRPVEYEQPIIDPNEELRLNKFMSNAGICSRREADEMIEKGLIKVNGEPVNTLGVKVKYGDIIEYDGKVVTPEKKVYVLLNKPKDCMTTTDDPKERRTVMDLVKGACQERIYPVGRLDRMTTGVLLLTNDGELASKLTHPQFVKKKIYHVWTDRDITEEDMQAIADGIELDDGPIHADAISYATETDRNQAGIEIHSGRNRIIRRIFEHLGYHVTKLDRVYFAGLTKKNLPRGRWRYLTQDEVTALQTGRFE